VFTKVGSLDGNDFQQAMKQDHKLAMEYIARLLRRTVNHNGPVKRHEIDQWLRRDAVAECVLSSLERKLPANVRSSLLGELARVREDDFGFSFYPRESSHQGYAPTKQS